MNLSDDCDLLYISCQFQENPVLRRTLARGEHSSGTLSGQLALTLRTKWLPTDEFSVSAVFCAVMCFAGSGRRSTHYAIIIAATLNTIRYSIVLSHC